MSLIQPDWYNTRTVGFADLVGVTTTVGVGTTVSLVVRDADLTEGIYANVEVVNEVSQLRTVVELYLDHDGSDTFVSEFYFDNDGTVESSDNFIGTFKGSINSGVLSQTSLTTLKLIQFLSELEQLIWINICWCWNIQIHTNTPAETEKSGRLQTNFAQTVGISTPISVSNSDVTTLKTLARVGYGNTSALHQLLVTHDGTSAIPYNILIFPLEAPAGLEHLEQILAVMICC